MLAIPRADQVIEVVLLLHLNLEKKERIPSELHFW